MRWRVVDLCCMQSMCWACTDMRQRSAGMHHACRMPSLRADSWPAGGSTLCMRAPGPCMAVTHLGDKPCPNALNLVVAGLKRWGHERWATRHVSPWPSHLQARPARSAVRAAAASAAVAHGACSPLSVAPMLLPLLSPKQSQPQWPHLAAAENGRLCGLHCHQLHRRLLFLEESPSTWRQVG
jgi:hypothetical protein